MSLNFISSAVLTSTDGISHNEEKAIENASTSSINRSSAKPLYEQLRSNAEKAQEEYDEITKQMRGTRPLDEEDIAHLTTVENVREEKERAMKRIEEEEVEIFRAAKMESKELVLEDDNYDHLAKGAFDTLSTSEGKPELEISFSASRPPQIVLKGKRRRKVEDTTERKAKKALVVVEKDIVGGKIQDDNKKNEDEGDLGGLLGGYGSDSSDTDQESIIAL